jgi:glycosyltransferase involved in cell wall biosynthesis
MSSNADAPEPRLERKLTLSVVIATYNRTPKLSALFRSLAEQSLPKEDFELILIDDGSVDPARTILDALHPPFRVRLIEQENAGQASARDRGIREATGDVVVVLDDDMRLDPHLLANHLAWHQAGYRVVLGRIDSSHSLDEMPLFERFHAAQLEKTAAAFRSGQTPRGVHLCTGNVSFRRQDYLDIGGFDRNLKRSEDRELGIRLEAAGATFVFGDDAVTVHDSDHTSLEVWLGRAFNYGAYDYRIHEKHPDKQIANPWRFFFLINPLSRPFMLAAIALPNVGKLLSRCAWKASEVCDQLGNERLAVQGVTYVYGIEYFRGLRRQSGSLARCLVGLADYFTRQYIERQPE